MSFILLDCPNLVHRAFHSTGTSMRNGTVYGFLVGLSQLRQSYEDHRFVFFWDHGGSKRKELFPDYKADRERRRKGMTHEERSADKAFRKDYDLLKHEVVWDLGYNNVRWQNGYEADDLIAHFIIDRDERTKGFSPNYVIVSSDQDFYQCLGPRVRMCKPHGYAHYTHEDFYKEYLIDPAQWHCVKALAGCPSDSVPGVKGVGVATAVQFLRGKLPATYKTHERILRSEELWLRNQRLVKLPLPGVRSFDLKEDSATVGKWNQVVSDLGMRSLREVTLR